MKILLVVMTGLGFTLGVVFGLLLQLPIDTYPAEQHDRINHNLLRTRRSLREIQDGLNYDENLNENFRFHSGIPVNPNGMKAIWKYNFKQKVTNLQKDKRRVVKEDNLLVSESVNEAETNNDQRGGWTKDLPRSLHKSGKSSANNVNKLKKQLEQTKDSQNGLDRLGLDRVSGQRFSGEFSQQDERIRDNLPKNENRSFNIPENLEEFPKSEMKDKQTFKREDIDYLNTIVDGVLWTSKLESSCPKLFQRKDQESWKNKVNSVDVVKMEEGCGRMQNRMLTLRDSSKACARYRLNTDQIQGEIFSYYLAKLLNISNIPPTVLSLVNSISNQWKNVHLDLSLAQWADSKLVVLTQFIPNLFPAHIPEELREDSRKLHPTLENLGSKSQQELCELVEWSDLIVFDYLTGNLDRVINNMFNKQWNDQMMHNPAHNLAKFQEGGLVFLDNESGLFHGYRLLDKYAPYHEALLHSLCIFRHGMVDIIKRLHNSGTVAYEVHHLFAQHESLHKMLSGIPDKNVKVLQKRVSDVYNQIVKCEAVYSR